MPEGTERSNGLTVGKVLTAAADVETTDFSMSMRSVLMGFINRVGGPVKFGEMQAHLFMSEQTSAASKIQTANNIMKMMAEYGEDDDKGLVDDGMVERWEQLRREEERSEAIDEDLGSE